MRHLIIILGLCLLATTVVPYSRSADADGFNVAASVEFVSMINNSGTRQRRVVVAVTPHRSLTITTPTPGILPKVNIRAIKEELLKMHPFDPIGDQSLMDVKIGVEPPMENKKVSKTQKDTEEVAQNDNKRMEVAMLLPSELSPEFNLDVSFE